MAFASHGSGKVAILDGYALAAPELIEKFEAVSSSELFAPVHHFLPGQPSRILDLGAGTGRDAAWFANFGHEVVAVEPVTAFRQAGVLLHKSPRIAWVDDTLPDLTGVLGREKSYDLINMNAVWQHLDNDQRIKVFPVLRRLAAVGGLVIMSIRSGPAAASRPAFEARVSDVRVWAESAGFQRVFQVSAQSVQCANRDRGVTWTWLVFRVI